MISKIIRLSVRNKPVTGLLLLLFIAAGLYSFSRLSVDALPDVTNNQVQVITNSPSLATQEVEQFVTTPLEMEFKSLQGLTELRSISRSGLSVITIVFKDNMPVTTIRQWVAEKLKAAEEKIPREYGVPDMVPPTTGLGEIFQYVLVAKKGYETRYDAMELRTIEDWIVKRQLLGTAGVVDVSSFGGKLKQYEVSVKPDRLAAMNLTLTEVFAALQRNNANTGGGYIDKGPNIYFIRGEGMITDLADIGNIVVRNTGGIPVLVKDIGTVQFGFAPRYGAMTRNGQGEAVGGIVLMQKGENAVRVIHRVKQTMAAIEKSLPEGVGIEVFIDRTKLIDRTISTVSRNLLEGAVIVIFVLVLFLGNFRAGLIVASVIPLSMLFAVCMMNLFGVSANLMSMGALDFGLIVDGAVIIVESLLHRFHADFRGMTLTREQMDGEVIEGSGRIMKSAAFGQVIILIVYVPIFALSGIEGKMFMPMAETVSFAIVGALLLSVTYVPLMSSLLLSRKIKAKDTLTDTAMAWLERWYQPVLQWALRTRVIVVTVAVGLLVGAVLLFRTMGGEFIPELDEGDFAVNYAIRQGSSLPQSVDVATQLEKIALSFPEVKEVVSKIGTSEVPTDPMPIESGDMIMVLKDRKEWVTAHDKDGLAEKMKEKMEAIPGVNLSFEQPIQMRFNELVAGVKGDIAIKIFGSDLSTLFTKANQTAGLIRSVPGLTDVKVEQTTGLPQLLVKYNRGKIAQYGLSIADVNAVLNTAYAGGYAGTVYEGERRFDLVVRIPKDSNTDPAQLRSLLVPTPSGKQIPLSEIADVGFTTSPAQISREQAERRIVIEANVRGRDVESVVNDIRALLGAKLALPEGYYITYGGQFEHLQEASSRLTVAVPVALLLIFFLLFVTFRSLKEALIIFSAIPLAAVGGVVALWLRGMPFSISAGIGFIALFGVAVLNGIVLISYYNRLRDEGETDGMARIIKGSLARLRPVLATASVASLGFFPMALSTSAGAEVQKPLATVVIGGLVSSTLLTLLVLPVLYSFFYVRRRVRPLVMLIGVLMLGGLGTVSAQTAPLSLDTALSRAYARHPVIRQGDQLVRQQQALLGTATVFDPLNINSSFGQINSSDFDYNVGVSQAFKLPGAYRAERGLLQQNVKVAEAAGAVTRAELTRNVRAAYTNWAYAWQRYNLLLSLDTAWRDFQQVADKRFAAGETGVLEKTNARTQGAEVQLQLRQARADIAAFAAELRQWMPGTDSLGRPDGFEPLPALESGDSALPSGHPLLQYARQQVEVSAANIRVEKARGLPSFSIGAATQSLDRVSPYNIMSVGASIPLFNYGVKSRVKAAEIGRQFAETGVEKTGLELTAAYRQWWEQYTRAVGQLDYYRQEGLRYAALILAAAAKGYRAGNIGYVEYVQNIKEATGIREGYLRTVNDYNQAVIQISYFLNR
ncbi:MAG TPA: CusA/CzcA family heavy metal efflux RND transporter [Puia sp.]|uniref:CusA/CzcA family heavy metal efflux RND transporter n=1 Tax=Puia sp. TaxID=2045100 RepID=UPI002B72C0E9|nr:CusA/CzcA family heavy metal efflux RND transporter [Puia sp.]HVU96870.1 CusA/CzcA family heavy metal efflux RND transporter [Puia sp.]